MRLLFLSYTFPGPLYAMASWLAANPENQVIFASSRSRQEMPLHNVQRVVMKNYPSRKLDRDPDYFDMWEEATRAGKSARSTLETVRQSGFEPDIIFSATSNGSALGLRHIFPDAFLVNFLEEELFSKPGQGQMRQNLQCLQILQANLNYAYTDLRRKSFPPELQSKIQIAPMCADTDFFSPAKAMPFECWKFQNLAPELVTVFARNLSEQGLFHCWNACLDILAHRPDCQIALLVNGSYAMRRLAHLEIPGHISQRLYIECHLRLDQMRDLLCASTMAVFPGFPVPFGLIESMGCGTAPVLAREKYFLKNDWDCLLMPGHKAEDMARVVNHGLDNRDATRLAGMRARQTAETNFAAKIVMPRFFPDIEKGCALWNGACAV